MNVDTEKTIIAPYNLGGCYEYSKGFKSVMKALLDVDVTPLEGDTASEWFGWCHRIRFYANESVGEFKKYAGYEVRIVEDELEEGVIDGLHLSRYHVHDVHRRPIYDKTIRTHEEVKEKMDELWESSTYDERFVLKRLYEFMEECYPLD